MALIEQDAGAGIDDLVALDEDGVVLRMSVGVELEAGEPGGSLEMDDLPHSGNLQRAELDLLRENRLDIVGDDAAVVGLGQVRHRIGCPVLDDLAGRAAAEGCGYRAQLPLRHTRARKIPSLLPAVRGFFACSEAAPASNDTRISARPGRAKGVSAVFPPGLSHAYNLPEMRRLIDGRSVGCAAAPGSAAQAVMDGAQRCPSAAVMGI